MRLPRRTVRLRLTLLYGGLFLASGAALLAITYVLVRHSTGGFVLFKGTRIDSPSRLDTGRMVPIPDALQPQADRLRAQAAHQRAEQLHQMLIQSGIALAFMSVASIGLGWLVAGRVLRPLEDTFEAQRRFVANASHELRTPLTMMRTSLDVATGKPGRAPPQMHALEGKLREGLDRADRLLEGFLTLARAQHGALPDQTTVSLPELLSTAIAAHGDAIAARGIDVRQAIGDAHVAGSETLLARMIENVLDNAVRHNEPSGWIRVETRAHGDVVRLIVETGGPRLAESGVRELAQPFRRIGADRTGSENGVGLGLSIVAAIAAAHGGKLDLHARPQGGLRVLIELPRAPVGQPA